MARYPKELPVFEIIRAPNGGGCSDCIGIHSEGAPTIYGGNRIDVWSCVHFFEPFDLERLKPLNTVAKEMVRAVKHGVQYPFSKFLLPI